MITVIIIRETPQLASHTEAQIDPIGHHQDSVDVIFTLVVFYIIITDTGIEK